MLSYANGVFTLNDEIISKEDALSSIVMTLVSSCKDSLDEATLRQTSALFDFLRPSLSRMETEELKETLFVCIQALLEAHPHRFSAHVLARVLFSIGKVLADRRHFVSINELIAFSSDTLFSMYLHDEECYRTVSYAFYATIGSHEHIEKKGYFDVMRYMERTRGYRGMEIDFMEITAYFVRAGLDSKETPYGAHAYYSVLQSIYNGYREVTENVPDRINEHAHAMAIYKGAMKRIPTQGTGDSSPVWPGAAYLVALYSGNYRKRLQIAKMYGAASACVKTDLDIEEEKITFRALTVITGLLLAGFFSTQKVLAFRASNPFAFTGVAGILVIAFILMCYAANAPRSSRSGYVNIYSPMHGGYWGPGYFY